MVVVAVVVVSLIVLEICLLAGPAFAVGARRSRRQLGLIGANGGDRRHLRAVMLAGGIVLGAAAAVIGLALGTLLALAARPWIEERNGSRFGAWDFRVPELAGIALLAVLVGLLAAVVPAIGAARADVLESLTGRRGVRRTGRALPVVGTVAVVLGVPLTLVGGLMWNSAPAVAGGAILTELGLVALTPLLVGAFGRLGRRLPLTARLALRDAARNRGRTAPAVAAVLAAVAGAVSVATVIASDDAEGRGEYVAELPEGTVAINAGWRDEGNLELAARLAEQHLPVETRADLAMLPPGPESSALLVMPEGAECPLWELEAESMTPAERRELQEDPRCAEGSAADMVAVAGPELLDVLDIGGPEARAALDRGDAVVLAEHLVADGRIEVAVFEEEAGYDESGEFIRPPDRTLAFPAHVVDAENMPFGYGAVVSPETARAAGTDALVDQVLMSTTRTPTGEEEQALAGALSDQLGSDPHLYIENGYEGDADLGLLILSLAALVITLGAAGIATGLAQADSEADLRTLAAVGAAPRLRRALSGLQCGMVAAMGVFLGALSGLVPAVGIVLVLHRDELDYWERGWDEGWETLESRPELYLELPWGTFAQLIVVVPLVACLMAALLTRSRVPLARRAG
ncbi:FtsX-like permease family protein [Streptomyces marincola]|uniref:FtsX-like permease family protein n=1 Tax=Streptomyces marincola TaxID=2878388 RepID=UPI001CF406CC|nr:FtsX-like permease family protein [Streptomyces marincola]UCM89022.1 FtsX-like permease family protein [Streptomyces marincola]